MRGITTPPGFIAGQRRTISVAAGSSPEMLSSLFRSVRTPGTGTVPRTVTDPDPGPVHGPCPCACDWEGACAMRPTKDTAVCWLKKLNAAA